MSKHLEDHLKVIETKIDKLDERLDKMANVQVEQAKDLEYHIKRTDLLEERVDPLFETQTQIIGILKFLGVVALVAGLIEVISSLV
jgi:hypothetical protein